MLICCYVDFECDKFSIVECKPNQNDKTFALNGTELRKFLKDNEVIGLDLNYKDLVDLDLITKSGHLYLHHEKRSRWVFLNNDTDLFMYDLQTEKLVKTGKIIENLYIEDIKTYTVDKTLEILYRHRNMDYTYIRNATLCHLLAKYSISDNEIKPIENTLKLLGSDTGMKFPPQVRYAVNLVESLGVDRAYVSYINYQLYNQKFYVRISTGKYDDAYWVSTDEVIRQSSFVGLDCIYKIRS